MLWIQNISLADVGSGRHFDAGPNSMLIQIVDPDMDFPVPKHEFKEIHQFQFLDVERDGLTNNGDGSWTDMSEFAITNEQAAELVRLLQHALKNRMQVVVHCHAGVCRSGAVAEVGIMMGFNDTESFRSPNLLVKHKMMKVLGWTYDENEPHTFNGVAIPEDWANDNEKVFILAGGRRAHREKEKDV
jgi:rhodanese-related sulfurtransferase